MEAKCASELNTLPLRHRGNFIFAEPDGQHQRFKQGWPIASGIMVSRVSFTHRRLIRHCASSKAFSCRRSQGHAKMTVLGIRYDWSPRKEELESCAALSGRPNRQPADTGAVTVPWQSGLQQTLGLVKRKK